MSNYVQTTFFAPKDTLPTTNPAKTIYGAAYDVEFGNIATAINTKYDSGSIAAGGIGFALGSAGSPSIYFGVANTSGFYGDGSAGISLSTSAIQRVNVNSAGNVTIAAPTSGTALTVTGLVGQYTAIFNSAGSNTVQSNAASGFEAGFQVTASGFASAGFVVNGTAGTDSYGIPTGTFGLGVVQAISLVLATAATARVTINSAGAVSIAAPSTGSALQVNGLSGSYIVQLVSGTPGTTSFPDLNVSRAGSTANTIQQGPNLVLQDSASSTYTTIQQSGGQTEIWQYNGGSWRQAMYFGSYSSGYLLGFPNAQTSGSATAGGVTVPGTCAGFMIVAVAGTSRKIPYYAT